MTNKRVVVTGAGLVTPAGIGLDINWEKIRDGRIAVTRLHDDDTTRFPVKLGGLVPEFEAGAYLKNRRNLRFLRKNVQFCLAAVQMALENAGLAEAALAKAALAKAALAEAALANAGSDPFRNDSAGYDPAGMGLYVGSGEPEVHYDAFFPALSHSLDESGAINPKKFGLFGMQALSPSFLLLDLVNNGFCYSSIEQGLMGPNNSFSGGLAGGHAVGEAFKAIQAGEIAVAVAGGHDSLLSCFENYYLYQATGLVTREAEPARSMKPYSKGRDGFVLAEGAGFLVLEERERAIERRAPLLGEIIGYSCNCDTGSDLFHPSPDGEALYQALGAAMTEAAIPPSRVDYINSEGWATLQSDWAETRAFKRFFGEACYRIPVSTIKPVIGNTGAAAAPIDCIISLLAMQKQLVPPTINYCGGDDECDLDYVGSRCRPHPIEYAVSVNQGLGGQNCVFVLRATG